WLPAGPATRPPSRGSCHRTPPRPTRRPATTPPVSEGSRCEALASTGSFLLQASNVGQVLRPGRRSLVSHQVVSSDDVDCSPFHLGRHPRRPDLIEGNP